MVFSCEDLAVAFALHVSVVDSKEEVLFQWLITASR